VSGSGDLGQPLVVAVVVEDGQPVLGGGRRDPPSTGSTTPRALSAVRTGTTSLVAVLERIRSTAQPAADAVE
jgi:hypothetical protein